MEKLQANEGKNLEIEVNGIKYLRIPVKTHVVMKEDDLFEVVNKYTKDIRKPDDIIFCSEKVIVPVAEFSHTAGIILKNMGILL